MADGHGGGVCGYWRQECNSADVEKALDDLTFRSLLVESAMLWVETQHAVTLSRDVGRRQLYTLREEARPDDVRASAAKAAAASLDVGGGSAVSKLSQVCEHQHETRPPSVLSR